MLGPSPVRRQPAPLLQQCPSRVSKETVALSTGHRSSFSHVYYDPLDDGMEFIWLSWQDIDRVVMERLIDQKLEEADFVPPPLFSSRAGQLPAEGEYPRSWGVMF